jgi:hypothetical protein
MYHIIGTGRGVPPYGYGVQYCPARSSLPGRALVPRSQFGVQMKPAVQYNTCKATFPLFSFLIGFLMP